MVPPAATPAPTAAPATTVPPGAKGPVALPSLAPGETITWSRVEKPRLDLVGIFVSSFWIVAIGLVSAILIGGGLGYWRSRRAEKQTTEFTRFDFR